LLSPGGRSAQAWGFLPRAGSFICVCKYRFKPSAVKLRQCATGTRPARPRRSQRHMTLRLRPEDEMEYQSVRYEQRRHNDGGDEECGAELGGVDADADLSLVDRE